MVLQYILHRFCMPQINPLPAVCLTLSSYSNPCRVCMHWIICQGGGGIKIRGRLVSPVALWPPKKGGTSTDVPILKCSTRLRNLFHSKLLALKGFWVTTKVRNSTRKATNNSDSASASSLLSQVRWVAKWLWKAGTWLRSLVGMSPLHILEDGCKRLDRRSKTLNAAFEEVCMSTE